MPLTLPTLQPEIIDCIVEYVSPAFHGSDYSYGFEKSAISDLCRLFLVCKQWQSSAQRRLFSIAHIWDRDSHERLQSFYRGFPERTSSLRTLIIYMDVPFVKYGSYLSAGSLLTRLQMFETVTKVCISTGRAENDKLLAKFLGSLPLLESLELKYDVRLLRSLLPWEAFTYGGQSTAVPGDLRLASSRKADIESIMSQQMPHLRSLSIQNVTWKGASKEPTRSLCLEHLKLTNVDVAEEALSWLSEQSPGLIVHRNTQNTHILQVEHDKLAHIEGLSLDTLSCMQGK